MYVAQLCFPSRLHNTIYPIHTHVVPLVGHGTEWGTFNVCLSMVQDLGK